MEFDVHDTTSIVVRERNRFLLVRRANRPEKGSWCFPGGHVDPGETVADAAQREAKEEAGDIEVEGKPFYVFDHEPFIAHRHRCHVFFGKVSGKVKAGSDAAEAGFFTLGEMRGMDLTNFTIHIANRMIEKGMVK